MTTHELAQLGLALVKEVVDGRGWANPCGENVAALEDACNAVLAEGDLARLRDALWSVLRFHGHSNADTECPACESAHAALAGAAQPQAEGARDEIARLALDALDAMDPIIFEKDWGSESPSDAFKATTSALLKIRALAAAPRPETRRRPRRPRGRATPGGSRHV
jgi:hypothetical protein